MSAGTGDQLHRKALDLFRRAGVARNDGDSATARALCTRAKETWNSSLNFAKIEVVRVKIRAHVEACDSMLEGLGRGVPAAPASRNPDKGHNGGGDGHRSDSAGISDQKHAGGDSPLEVATTAIPGVTFSDVKGLDATVNRLRQAALLPARQPQIFTGRKRPFTKFMLYGPPGTGKTLLARAVANAVGGSFFQISAADVVGKWMGESEGRIKALFASAKSDAPAVIFVDEIDALGATRGPDENEATTRIKTQFMQEMNDLDGRALDKAVFVICATNCPFRLDAALRRRFESRIYIPLPDAIGRGNMLSKELGEGSGISVDDIMVLAKSLVGYSGADMNVLVKEALAVASAPINEATHFRAGDDGMFIPCDEKDEGSIAMDVFDVPNGKLAPAVLTIAHLQTAAGNVRPSVSQDDLADHERFTQQFGREG